MPERVRRGDFLVPRDDLEAAQETFEDRSPQSRKRDKALRGPIVTDPEIYELTNGRLFDYPGVDTPRDEPKAGVMDLPFPDESWQPNEDGMMVSQEPETVREGVEDNLDQGKEQMQNLWGMMFK